MLNIQITQYGPSPKVGGWDSPGDSGTDAGRGCHDNQLEDGISCALSKPAENQLGIKPGQWLKIQGSNGVIYRRRFDDRTDQTLPNARVDFYEKDHFDHSISDEGLVLSVE